MTDDIDYGALLDEEKERKEAEVRSGVYLAAGANPDEEGALRVLSRKAGVPVEALRSKEIRSEVERKAAVDDIDYGGLLDAAPVTAGRLTDPAVAPVIRDDVDNLAGIERLVNTWGKTPIIGAPISTLGIASPQDKAQAGEARRFFGGTGRSIAGGVKASPSRFSSGLATTGAIMWDTLGMNEMFRSLGMEDLADAPGYASRYWRKEAEARQYQPKEGETVAKYAGEAAESLGTSTLSAPFGLAGQASQLVMFALSAGDGERYEAMRKAGYSAPLAAAVSLSNQAMEGLTEKLGLDSLYDGGKPAIRRVSKFLLGDLAGEEINTIYSWVSDKVTLRPDMTVADLAGQMVDTGIVTAMMGGGQAAVTMPFAQASRAYQDRQEERLRVRFMESLGKSGKESKLLKRDPDTLHAFVAEVTKDGPVENLYVPADAWEEYWQGRGVDGAAAAAEIGALEYEEAKAAGGDVVVPLAAWVTKIAPTEHHEGLLEDARIGIGTATLREIRDGVAKREERVKRLADLAKEGEELEAKQADPDTEWIVGQITGEWLAAYPDAKPEEVDFQARQMARTFRALSARWTKENPDAPKTTRQLFEDYRISVGRQEREAAAAPAVEAAAAPLEAEDGIGWIDDALLEELDAEDAAEDPAVPYAGQDRRSALPYEKVIREEYDALADDEKPDVSIRHALSLLGSRQAHDLAKKRPGTLLPVRANGDLDSFKYLNEMFGHGSADEILRIMGTVFREVMADAPEAAQAFHPSGDELWFYVQDGEVGKVYLEALRIALRTTTFVFEHTPSGLKARVKGVDFSYGLGKDEHEAESGLSAHKAERRGRNELPPANSRGVAPQGLEVEWFDDEWNPVPAPEWSPEGGVAIEVRPDGERDGDPADREGRPSEKVAPKRKRTNPRAGKITTYIRKRGGILITPDIAGEYRRYTVKENGRGMAGGLFTHGRNLPAGVPSPMGWDSWVQSLAEERPDLFHDGMTADEFFSALAEDPDWDANVAVERMLEEHAKEEEAERKRLSAEARKKWGAVPVQGSKINPGDSFKMRGRAYRALGHTREGVLVVQGKTGKHYVPADGKIEIDGGVRGIKRKAFRPTGEEYQQAAAFHGSPHKFDRFSTSAIGTGEGAQAYGWGLYFASAKEVAKHYRDALTPRAEFVHFRLAGRDVFRDGRYIDYSPRDNSNREGVWAILVEDLLIREGDLVSAYGAGPEQLKDHILNTLDERMADWEESWPEGIPAAKQLRKEIATKKTAISMEVDSPTGRLYHVELAPAEDEYLLWDKPFDEQSEKVRESLKKAKGDGDWRERIASMPVKDLEKLADNIDGNNTIDEDWDGDTTDDQKRADLLSFFEAMSEEDPKSFVEYMEGGGFSESQHGSGVYKQLISMMGSDRAASEYLHSLGISGIKYLDGSSRGKGEGDYNYVIFSDEDVEITQYEQPDISSPRGLIRVNRADGRVTFDISLLERADRSTFTHECGHAYLEILRDLAAKTGAEDSQLRADWDKAREYLGIPDDLPAGTALGTEAQEKWAESIEAWFAEGKAPAPELQPVFFRFKAWMKLIYNGVRRTLNVRLNDDIREVFSRLVATDEEIARAQEAAGQRPLFATAKDAGMTEAEFSDYQKRQKDANRNAVERLEDVAMAEIFRETSAEWKAEKKATTAAVQAEAEALPVYQAKAYLATEEAAGVSLDLVAEMFGFASGAEMQRAIGEALPLSRFVAGEVRRRMLDKWGDFVNNAAEREQKALEAVHSDAEGKVLSAELMAIRRLQRDAGPMVRRAKREGEQDADATARWYAAERKTADQKDAEGRRSVLEGIPTAKDFLDAARGIIDGKAPKDIHPHRYLVASKQAAEKVVAAMARKDYQEAGYWQEKRLLNHYLYREAVTAKAEVEAIQKYATRLQQTPSQKRLGKIEGDHLDQINALLERYEFIERPLWKLNRRESLLEWARRQEEMGLEPVIDPAVLADAGVRNWKTVPVAELRGLRDTLKSIEALARINGKLQRGKAEIEFRDGINALLEAARKNVGTGKRPPVDKATRSWLQKKGVSLSKLDASLLKVEQVVEWLDGGEIDGPWAELIFRPIAEAQAREYDLGSKYAERIGNLFEELGKRRGAKALLDLVPITAMGESITRQAVLAVALNTGNAGNYQRLVDGWSDRGGQAAVDEILATLTEADWRWVQSVWDEIDTLWPEVEALEKRMSGVAPPKVEAREFQVTTADGKDITLRGGYYPAVYDPEESGIGARQSDTQAEKLYEDTYPRATLEKGHTKKRADKVERPLSLSLDVIPRHIAGVIHDLAFRDAVVQVHRVLSNEEIRTAIRDSLGLPYHAAMVQWLAGVANDRNFDQTASGFWNGLISRLRTNATIVAMGFKATTMCSQITGLSQSLDTVKGRYLQKAVRQFARHPLETTAWAQEKSGEMRHRFSSLDRDVRDGLRKLQGKKSPLAWVQREAFTGIAMFDAMVSIPTWMGAYEQAKAEGMTEDNAIAHADRAVRLSQGAGGAKDLAAVQRNNELLKLFTMFYSYFNVLYNRGRDASRSRDVGQLAWRSLILWLIPAVMGELLAARGPDDDEDAGEWALRKIAGYPFLAVPILRDLSGEAEALVQLAFGEKPDWRPLPMTPAGSLVKEVREVARAGSLEGAAAQAVDVAGLIIGLPTGQAKITGGYLWDIATGDESPEGVGEFLRNILFRRRKAS